MPFDLPRFVLLRWDSEIDIWKIMATALTYSEAKERLIGFRNKGYDDVYLTATTFLAGPADKEFP